MASYVGATFLAWGWYQYSERNLIDDFAQGICQFVEGRFLNRTFQDVEQKAEPPIIAEFLVGLFAKRRYRNGLLQNLEEEFEGNLAAGATVRRARRKYWAAALNSIGPQLLAAAKRVGIIGLIADYARRLLH